MAGFAATRFTITRARVFGSNHQVRFSSSSDAAKRGIDELKKVSNEIKETAASQAGFAVSKSKEAAGEAENITDKAKQSAQEAWSASKDAAQKVQSTVAEKAEASADIVKDNIESAKSCLKI